MDSAYSSSHGAANGAAPARDFTLTALGRWSSQNKPLPPVDKIKALHVYDFDNTLFQTPLPNPSVWNGPTIGKLAAPDIFLHGGWWHDARILAATGQGLATEEARAWQGWWNEEVVELVRLTMQQPDALCVLLTGRAESTFADLIKRMVASKGLEFDMVGLKPQVSPANDKFQSTMHFKHLFLQALMETYRAATEIRVYEDRPKHTKGFRDFFAEYNRRQALSPTRGPLHAEVMQVADKSARLDPVVEVAEVQHMVNLHNAALLKQPPPARHNRRLQVKKTVFFTSYMMSPADTNKILKLAPIPSHLTTHDLKYHANNILICPRPCPPNILEKVGGIGSKMSWQVTGFACYENRIWAARVQPVPPTAVYHTENPVPLVVLALRKGSRPMDAGKITNWQPLSPHQALVFDTTVGEKVILRVDSDDPKEDAYESLFANKAAKRKHAGDDDWVYRSAHGHYAGRNESRGYHSGSRGRARGGPRGGGGRGGRGRGGFHGYRSLDDVQPKSEPSGHGLQVDYDDAYQPPGQRQPAPTGPHARGALQQGRGGVPARHMGGASSFHDTDLHNYY